jgi:hypothetical protein
MAKRSRPIPACKYCKATDWERQQVEEVTTKYLLDLNGVWRVMDVGPSYSETNFWCRNCHELLIQEKKAVVLCNLPVDHIQPCGVETVRETASV